MTTSFGLDLTKNYSWFALPAAVACAHLPHVYPLLFAGNAYDNANPRAFKDRINAEPSLSQEAKEHFLRAKRASENGYETLGLFAAAVVAGNVAGLSNHLLNWITWGYIASRVAYNFVYIELGGNAKTAVIRSWFWSVSMWLSTSLFVLAGVNANRS